MINNDFEKLVEVMEEEDVTVLATALVAVSMTASMTDFVPAHVPAPQAVPVPAPAVSPAPIPYLQLQMDRKSQDFYHNRIQSIDNNSLPMLCCQPKNCQ